MENEILITTTPLSILVIKAYAKAPCQRIQCECWKTSVRKAHFALQICVHQCPTTTFAAWKRLLAPLSGRDMIYALPSPMIISTIAFAVPSRLCKHLQHAQQTLSLLLQSSYQLTTPSGQPLNELKTASLPRPQDESLAQEMETILPLSLHPLARVREVFLIVVKLHWDTAPA